MKKIKHKGKVIATVTSEMVDGVMTIIGGKEVYPMTTPTEDLTQRARDALANGYPTRYEWETNTADLLRALIEARERLEMKLAQREEMIQDGYAAILAVQNEQAREEIQRRLLKLQQDRALTPKEPTDG